MKKNTLLKHILSLGLLLLSGHGQLFALKYKDGAQLSSVTVYEGSTNTTVYATHNTHDSFVKTASSSAEGENRIFGIAAIEAKEDEVNASKRLLEISNYVAVLFDVRTYGQFLYYVEKCLPLSRYSSHISSGGLHLVFRIFRI